MSLTIQQIITDAKRLASRLKERDLTADVLLNETQVINKKIDAMKQVRDMIIIITTKSNVLSLVPGRSGTSKRGGPSKTSFTVNSKYTKGK